MTIIDDLLLALPQEEVAVRDVRLVTMANDEL